MGLAFEMQSVEKGLSPSRNRKQNTARSRPFYLILRSSAKQVHTVNGFEARSTTVTSSVEKSLSSTKAAIEQTSVKVYEVEDMADALREEIIQGLSNI